jgi:hypothetical protein
MIKDLSRRTILTAPALLSLVAGTDARAEPTGTPRSAGSTSLVIYFSRSGNTRVIAGTIQRALAADLFEIRPVLPYPEDYEQTVEQARQERDRGYQPPLAATIPDMAAYDILYQPWEVLTDVRLLMPRLCGQALSVRS